MGERKKLRVVNWDNESMFVAEFVIKFEIRNFRFVQKINGDYYKLRRNPPHGEDSVSRTINFIVHCFEMNRLLRIH